MGLTESTETTEISLKWNKLDEVSKTEIYAEISSEFV